MLLKIPKTLIKNPNWAPVIWAVIFKIMYDQQGLKITVIER